MKSLVYLQHSNSSIASANEFQTATGRGFGNTHKFTSKLFSATKAKDREELGEKVTGFLRDYSGQVVDKVVAQSSDNEFHCLTVILFCRDNGKRRREHGRSQHQDG